LTGLDENPEAAIGVWYLTKQRDKLRIAQERWNYCYDNKGVSIDDIYFHALSLIRK
jgi:hypothetical protein